MFFTRHGLFAAAVASAFLGTLGLKMAVFLLLVFALVLFPLREHLLGWSTHLEVFNLLIWTASTRLDRRGSVGKAPPPVGMQGLVVPTVFTPAGGHVVEKSGTSAVDMASVASPMNLATPSSSQNSFTYATPVRQPLQTPLSLFRSALLTPRNAPGGPGGVSGSMIGRSRRGRRAMSLPATHEPIELSRRRSNDFDASSLIPGTLVDMQSAGGRWTPARVVRNRRNSICARPLRSSTGRSKTFEAQDAAEALAPAGTKSIARGDRVAQYQVHDLVDYKPRYPKDAPWVLGEVIAIEGLHLRIWRKGFQPKWVHDDDECRVAPAGTHTGRQGAAQAQPLRRKFSLTVQTRGWSAKNLDQAVLCDPSPSLGPSMDPLQTLQRRLSLAGGLGSGPSPHLGAASDPVSILRRRIVASTGGTLVPNPSGLGVSIALSNSEESSDDEDSDEIARRMITLQVPIRTDEEDEDEVSSAGPSTGTAAMAAAAAAAVAANAKSPPPRRLSRSLRSNGGRRRLSNMSYHLNGSDDEDDADERHEARLPPSKLVDVDDLVTMTSWISDLDRNLKHKWRWGGDHQVQVDLTHQLKRPIEADDVDTLSRVMDQQLIKLKRTRHFDARLRVVTTAARAGAFRCVSFLLEQFLDAVQPHSSQVFSSARPKQMIPFLVRCGLRMDVDVASDRMLPIDSIARRVYFRDAPGLDRTYHLRVISWMAACGSPLTTYHNSLYDWAAEIHLASPGTMEEEDELDKLRHLGEATNRGLRMREHAVAFFIRATYPDLANDLASLIASFELEATADLERIRNPEAT